MLGIDDMILLPLIGSAVGGLTSKKNPFQGALLGAGLGAAGAAVPGLLATQGAAPGMAGSLGSGLSQGVGQGMAEGLGGGLKLASGTPMSIASGATNAAGADVLGTGLLPNGPVVDPVLGHGYQPNELLARVKELTQPMAAGLSAASAVKNLNQRQPVPQAQFTPPMPNNNLGQMVASMDQSSAQMQQLEAQRRAMRRQSRGLL